MDSCNIFGIYTSNTDWLDEYKNTISRGITQLESFLEQLEWIPLSVNLQKLNQKKIINNIGVNNKNIFIVHGHNNEDRQQVELFVKAIDYTPITLFKEPNKGQTIIEKIESNTNNVCFAIVLYTACDEGRLKGEERLQARARQNVVFEHGYMCSKLGRDHVVALLENDVEQPGDLSGVIYVNLDKDGAWKLKVIQEMKAIGLDVDANKLINM